MICAKWTDEWMNDGWHANEVRISVYIIACMANFNDMLYPGSAKRRRSESGLSHRETSSKREDSSSPPRSTLKEEKPFIGPSETDGSIQVTQCLSTTIHKWAMAFWCWQQFPLNGYGFWAHLDWSMGLLAQGVTDDTFFKRNSLMFYLKINNSLLDVIS